MGLTILNLGEAKREMQKFRSAQNDREEVRAVEAASPVLFQGTPGTDGFRRLSQMQNVRDLLPQHQERMQRIAYYLYVANPLAQAIVELTKDFIVGEGVTVQCEDAAAQELVDDFWDDPANAMDLTLESVVRELGIFGEQLLYCPTNPINGQVRLSYIDPAWIDTVEYATLEGLPGIAITQPMAVRLRKPAGESEGRRLEIVHLDEDPDSPTFGQLTGECFYWAINKARAGTRGISDLFALADWTDGYDKMLFALMKQVDSLSRFIWDVKMTGMTEEQIEDWLKKHGAPPAANSVRAHNENVEWSAVAPAIQAGDKSEAVRLIKNFVLGGRTFPEHWFADGSATNRATALEQGEPSLKRLTSRQRFVKHQVRQLIAYVIDRRVAAGALPESASRRFEVQFPELSVRDQAKIAGALQSAAQALSMARAEGAMDRETMARLVAAIASQLGVEVDAEEVLAKAAAERAEQEQRDYLRYPPTSLVPVPDAEGAIRDGGADRNGSAPPGQPEQEEAENG